MITIEGHEFRVQAAEALFEAGFQSKSYADLAIPPIKVSAGPDNVESPFVVFGDANEARSIHITSVPYSTRVSDKSQLVRAAAQHVVLGPETALVVAQLYDPKNQRFNHSERKQTANGSFRPLAQRLSGVIEHVGVRDDQTLDMSGFSMAADVGVEAVWLALHDSNFSFPEVSRLGVFDPARVVSRGAIGVSIAFAGSGKGLFQNVVNSHSPALLEARGINPQDPEAEKKHEKSVNLGVVEWNLADPLGNIALMRGFGTNVTTLQLAEIVRNEDSPRTVVVRMEDSRVCPAKDLESLSVPLVTESGDHSAADNILRGASFALQTAAL